MGLGSFVHHIGTVLLLVATVLLIVVDVTAPVVNYLNIMHVDLGNTVEGNEVTFGTFGYCHRGVQDADLCSRSRIGYNPAQVMNSIDGTEFGSAAETTTKVLTRVMVLYPIATVLCFIAFLLCVGAGVAGALLASIFALLSFIVTVIVMICDFVGFSIIKNNVNDNDRSTAHWGSGIWCILASAIFTLLAAAVVLASCCAGRAKRHREATRAKESVADAARPPPKWKFWQRR